MATKVIKHANISPDNGHCLGLLTIVDERLQFSYHVGWERRPMKENDLMIGLVIAGGISKRSSFYLLSRDHSPGSSLPSQLLPPWRRFLFT